MLVGPAVWSERLMPGLWRPFLAGPLKHAARLASDAEYRETCRLESALGGTPRFRPRHVRTRGLSLHIPDAASFLASYRELFLERSLSFRWEGPAPRILDLGANIGLSVIHYKREHPDARVTALEADPAMFRYLEENVRGAGYRDVDLINEAAWDAPGTIVFRPDGADGGRAIGGGAVIAAQGGVTSSVAAGTIQVPAIDLAAFLDGRAFDVVKMDIEGAEARVLPSIADRLGGVRYLFVEYHSRPTEPQALDAVVGAMAGAGFRIHVRTVVASPTPFLGQDPVGDHDLILHLYGVRP